MSKFIDKIVCVAYIVIGVVLFFLLGDVLGGMFYDDAEIWSMEMALIPAAAALIIGLLLIYGGTVFLKPMDEKGEESEEGERRPGLFCLSAAVSLIVLIIGLAICAFTAEFYTEDGVQAVNLTGAKTYTWQNVQSAELAGEPDAPELTLTMDDGEQYTYGDGGTGVVSDGFDAAYPVSRDYIVYVSGKLEQMGVAAS